MNRWASESMRQIDFWLGALILGAGRSTRMGRPKLLLSWGRTSIVGHLLEQWRQAGALQVIVVYAEHDRAMIDELDRLGVSLENRVANRQVNADMFSSVVCAARCSQWHPSMTHCAIVLGDQPHLHQNTLANLAKFASRHPDNVSQPVLHGRNRHPIVLPRKMLQDLAQSGAQTLKEFLRDRPIAALECDDPGLDLDIDRPEDYQRAMALAGLEPTTR